MVAMVTWCNGILYLCGKTRNTRFSVFVADMLKDNLDSKCTLIAHTECVFKVRTYRVYSWMASRLVDHIWGEGTAPDTAQLRKQVIVEPMKDSSLPEDARFMRLAQERLRNAYITASMSIDDDKIRKIVRRRLKEMGGILPHASSGGVYFIYDKEKQYASMLSRLNEIIEHFALMANSRDRDAMWVERESPWWETMTNEERNDAPIVAHYESGFRTLAYGSSPKQLEDIANVHHQHAKCAS